MEAASTSNLRVVGAECEWPEVVPTSQQADMAIEAIIADIEELYLPYRGQAGYGTERAILPEPAHVPHRENDAEHTWNVENVIQMLWHNRELFGLKFPESFSIEKALQYAHVHDMVEIKARDVDTLTQDAETIKQKKIKEEVAVNWLKKTIHRRWAADLWEEYDAKDTPEAQFVSDVDKVVGCAVITADGGRRWHDWEGESASLAFMSGR